MNKMQHEIAQTLRPTPRERLANVPDATFAVLGKIIAPITRRVYGGKTTATEIAPTFDAPPSHVRILSSEEMPRTSVLRAVPDLITIDTEQSEAPQSADAPTNVVAFSRPSHSGRPHPINNIQGLS